MRDLLLSAKGGDITTWRAVEDFAAEYRKSLLELAASDRSGNAEAVLSKSCAEIATAIATHQRLLQDLKSMTLEASTAPITKLEKLAITFFGDLYRHFGLFRSSPAFYQLSIDFLQRTSANIFTQAKTLLGPDAANLPEMTLIAVGPAGRCEYSPYCRLQLLLVHSEVAAAHLKTIDLFCQSIHAGFEATGLPIDPVITPRNPGWRGTLTEWQKRCEDGMKPQAVEELINICRLVDQYPLFPAEGFAWELKQISSRVLSGNRPALANLIVRMSSISNGLGFMGRLKLERSGIERGKFDLLNHGLLPFSAALSALALIRESQEPGNCDRIIDLLKRQKLDVELAERMLTTWHTLNDLRLRLEQSFNIAGESNRSLCLDTDELTGEQRHDLKEVLESVATIQHHVEIIFSGIEE